MSPVNNISNSMSIIHEIKNIRARLANYTNYNEPRTMKKFIIIRNKEDNNLFLSIDNFDYHYPIILFYSTPESLNKAFNESILTFVVNLEGDNESMYYKFRPNNTVETDDNYSHYGEFKKLLKAPKTLDRVVRWISKTIRDKNSIRKIITSGKPDDVIYDDLRTLRIDQETNDEYDPNDSAKYFASQILNIIPNDDTVTLLNIGAGTGLIDHYLQDTKKVNKSICVDIRDICTEPCGCHEYFIYDGVTLDDKIFEKYPEINYALFSMVLHHVNKLTREKLYKQLHDRNIKILIREHNPGSFDTLENDKLFLNIQHGVYALTGEEIETPEFLDNFYTDFKNIDSWIEEFTVNNYKSEVVKKNGNDFYALFTPI